MAKYINKQGEEIVMKLSEMSVEQRREYKVYKNLEWRKRNPDKFRSYNRKYMRKNRTNATKKFETTNALQITIQTTNRQDFNIIQQYIREEIQEPDVLKDLGLLEEFLAKQATKPEPFLIQLKDVVCEISRYIVNRLKDGTHSLRVIVYSRTKNDIKLGSNSLLVEQLVKL